MLSEALILKGLSRREAEVATLVISGLTNKEVASELFVTEKTVKFHLTNIFKKMHVKSRAQLIVWSMPHMDFNDKMAATKPPEIKNMDSGNIPVGINKIGNA